MRSVGMENLTGSRKFRHLPVSRSSRRHSGRFPPPAPVRPPLFRLCNPLRPWRFQCRKANRQYVRLSGGYIASNCGLRSPKIAMSMRLRGKGTLWICMLRYTKGFKKNIATTRLKTLEVDSEHWKNYSFVVDRPGDKDEEQVLMFWPNAKNAVVDMDDISVSPRE